MEKYRATVMSKMVAQNLTKLVHLADVISILPVAAAPADYYTLQNEIS
jgi:hypothetical protein